MNKFRLILNIAFLWMLWPSLSQAQGTLSPVGQQVFLDNSGNPLNNAKICTYAAGSSTPLATYSNVTLTTANANPVRTSSAGRPTTGGIYLSPTSYKFIVLTAGTDSTCNTGTTIWSQDNITAVPASNIALDTTGTAGEALALGDVVYLSDGTGGTTAGRWYQADADTTYKSSTAGTVGMAVAAIASGASGSIRLSGRLTGLSALTTGELYYASATAGALTATPPTNQRFIGQADLTTSLVISGNPGGVRLPDNTGAFFVTVIVPTALTADRLFNLVVPNANTTFTLTGNATVNQDTTTTATGVSFNQFRPPQGRLTLTTALPVTTADVTAATTLYYALYGGNQITLYDGSTRWVQLPFTQLSITLVGLTASKPYDVFIDYTAGVPALELVVWTNDTTRATPLTTQNGVYVQTADTDSLYVGTIYIDAAGGAVTDSLSLRHVWNYYNRVPRLMRVVEATDTWAYTLAAWQQARASAANQLDFVIGVAEVALDAQVMGIASNDTALVTIGVAIGLDSVTAFTSGTLAPTNNIQVVGNRYWVSSSLRTYPAAGRHYAAWLEYSGAVGITTWTGDGGAATVYQSGIHGTIWG